MSLLPGNSDRMRGDGLNLHWGGSGWILGNISSPKEWWCREVVQSPSLKMFKKCGDVALRNTVSEHGGGGLGVGLDGLRCLANLNDSMY